MAKTNKAMRAASGLLVLTLLSTCMISGTFAKYTTGDSGSDTANVAKFGVEVTSDDAMFQKNYDGTVVTTGETNVVAPGTKGQLTDSVMLTGKPEVKVGVSNKATVTLTGWTLKDTGTVYCPIKVTVGDKPITCNGDLAKFKSDIETAINNYHKEYDPNTDLSTVDSEIAPAVSWEWAYEGNDDTSDTDLGDQAAEGNPSSIKVEIATTVDQID